MATRRNPIRPARSNSINYNNFNPSDFDKTRPQGTKPTPPQSSIGDVLLTLAIDLLCKKYMMYNIKRRICIYLGILFMVSIIGDVLPYPKTFLAQSNHFVNQYFVKIGWGWTLIATIPFVCMTSYTYCCSNRGKVISHLSRLGIATFFWLFWTNVFNYIESIYGRCSIDKIASKSNCLLGGARWKGFDISGHSFILIYSVLLIIEESRPIQGWELIGHEITSEKHSRAAKEKSGRMLQGLTLTDINCTEKNYNGFKKPVCFNVIFMSLLVLMWDFMILVTAVYYHSMIEKFVSGIVAIVTWYITYGFWFKYVKCPPLPGEGNFKYYERKSENLMNGSTIPRR